MTDNKKKYIMKIRKYFLFHLEIKKNNFLKKLT